MKNNISAIIIAKNEENLIEECLRSVLFCDQIIVVDNNSTDNTAEVAKQAGAEIYKDSSMNFSELRNNGLKKAKGEWILYIDADERVSSELAKEIEKTLQGNPLETVFMLPRKNFYLGNHEWPKIEYMPRLFKKSSLKEWQGELHESPVTTGNTKILSHYLLHYTHRTLEEMVKKTIIWSQVEAELRFNAHHPQITWWRFPRVMLTAFLNSYITQGGWKVGVLGLIESMYQAFSIFMTYARLWEMQQKNPKR